MKVVVGIVQNDKKEILIAKRPLGKPNANTWEFPGGKIEKNEKPFAALCREFMEEVNIVVLSATHWFNFDTKYTSFPIAISVWHINQYEGTPIALENQIIFWAAQNKLAKINFLRDNEIIIKKLQYQ